MAKIIKNVAAKRIRCPECKSTIEFDISDVKVKDENWNDTFIVCPAKDCKTRVDVKNIPARWTTTIQYVESLSKNKYAKNFY